MRLLIDSDAFCKLGACGLLDATAEVLGASAGDCSRLSALSYMLQHGSLADRLGPERCAALLPLAEAMPTAPPGDEGWLSAMVDITQIDAGEAQLFAAAAVVDCLVLSGDKRAMEVIDEVPGLLDALRGKIVCLEAVALRLCEQMGVEAVRARIAPALDLDTALSACFNSANAEAGLRSYLDALRGRVPPGLLWE